MLLNSVNKLKICSTCTIWVAEVCDNHCPRIKDQWKILYFQHTSLKSWEFNKLALKFFVFPSFFGPVIYFFFLSKKDLHDYKNWFALQQCVVAVQIQKAEHLRLTLVLSSLTSFITSPTFAVSVSSSNTSRGVSWSSPVSLCVYLP